MSENEIREYALMKATFKWLLIGMLWQGLELWFYGTTRPSNEDTIIGFFLWYYIVRCECMKRGVWRKGGGDNGKRKTKAQAIRDEFQSGGCNTGNETASGVGNAIVH